MLSPFGLGMSTGEMPHAADAKKKKSKRAIRLGLEISCPVCRIFVSIVV